MPWPCGELPNAVWHSCRYTHTSQALGTPPAGPDPRCVQCVTAKPGGVEIASNERTRLRHPFIAGIELDVQVIHVGCCRFRSGQHRPYQSGVVTCGHGHEGANRCQNHLSVTFSDLDDGIQQVALNALDEREVLDEQDNLLALLGELRGG